MLDRDENDQRIKAIWDEIQRSVRTDGQALDIFCNHWQDLGIVRCPRCSCDKVTRSPGEREGKCDNCKQKCWFTSGTMLERATLFKGYLAAALFGEEGLTISGPEFSRLTGIPQTSSYTILRKFRMAICDYMPAEAVNFSGSLLQFLIAKRTVETPARCHPYAEQKLTDEALLAEPLDHPDGSCKLGIGEVNNAYSGTDEVSDEVSAEVSAEVSDEVGDDKLSEYEKVKKVVLSLLSDVGLTADTISLRTGFAIGRVIAGLSELELFGDARVEPGGKYFKCDGMKLETEASADNAKELLLAISGFVDFVVEYFHRVGRKGLQTYVAARWCALDRERWGKGSLMRLSGEHPPVPYRQIRDYVSPPLLKILVD